MGNVNATHFKLIVLHALFVKLHWDLGPSKSLGI